MTDFEKNNDIVELSPEALEQAAGGAEQSNRIVVTKRTYLYKGPGKDFTALNAVYPGEGLKYVGPTQADARGVNWYGVGKFTGSVVYYISSRCCKFV